jgi:hypothetical protein
MLLGSPAKQVSDRRHRDDNEVADTDKDRSQIERASYDRGVLGLPTQQVAWLALEDFAERG